MNLTAIQKGLLKAKCPYCERMGTLWAKLSCSLGRKCEVFCYCNECKNDMLFQDTELPETGDVRVICDSITRSCHLAKKDVA